MNGFASVPGLMPECFFACVISSKTSPATPIRNPFPARPPVFVVFSIDLRTCHFRENPVVQGTPHTTLQSVKIRLLSACFQHVARGRSHTASNEIGDSCLSTHAPRNLPRSSAGPKEPLPCLPYRLGGGRTACAITGKVWVVAQLSHYLNLTWITRRNFAIFTWRLLRVWRQTERSRRAPFLIRSL